MEIFSQEFLFQNNCSFYQIYNTIQQSRLHVNLTHRHITIQLETFLSHLSPRLHVSINIKIETILPFKHIMVLKYSNAFNTFFLFKSLL